MSTVLMTAKLPIADMFKVFGCCSQKAALLPNLNLHGTWINHVTARPEYASVLKPLPGP